MGRGWKSFEVHIRKAQISMNELLKVILVKAKKEESCTENIKCGEYVSNHEQNVGITWMVKVILMRYQVK